MTTAPTKPEPPEKYLSAKELSARLHELGLKFSEDYVRLMLRAGVKRIGLNARLSDLLAWHEAHPDFKPFSRDEGNRAPITTL